MIEFARLRSIIINCIQNRLDLSRPAKLSLLRGLICIISVCSLRCFPIDDILRISGLCLTNALWNKSNGSYDIKDFGTLPLIFSTSKYFRRKFQPCPSFFSHPNIPDKWKRLPLSLDQMKKKEKVKVKS